MKAAGVIIQRPITSRDRDAIADACQSILARHSWVKAAYLYGSAASSARPARDVDIGLVGAGRPPWGAEAEIAGDLCQRVPLEPIEYDVRCLLGASPVFLNQVLRHGRLIYEADRQARIWFEAHAMAQWLDFRPVWDRIRKEVLKSWAHG